MAILSAIDGTQSSGAVVQTGYDLATAFDEELIVLHVMPQDQFENISERFQSEGSVTYPIETKGDVSVPASAGEGDGYPVDIAADDAASVARESIPDTIGSDANISTRGRVGEPTDEITKEIDRSDARYLVIGGRKRSPVGKALFGSTTQSILLNTDRPVMTVMQEE